MNSDTIHPDDNHDKMQRIGHATARLHKLLKQQGHIDGLQQSASTMPDARERLSFIDDTMHDASEKSLQAVETAMPLATQTQHSCSALAEQLANTPELAQHALIGETIQQLQLLANNQQQIQQQLTAIMEAQAFRDIAGQMVDKLVDAAVEIESILLELLQEYAPDDQHSLIRKDGLTSGPAMKGDTNSVTNQDDVDDLLSSLGF